jgi:hypothetical protein
VRGRRADVAKTISYRRRKGVLPMLEELARDVTGWGAHAVAAFELLAWTQQVNHVRLLRAADATLAGHLAPPAADRVGTAHLRNRDAMDLLGGPFDLTAHTTDVRRPRQREGWYGIRKALFFLWRLEAFAVWRSQARRVATSDALRWHFSPLGNPAPLFTRQQPVAEDPGVAGERNVPGPVRPLAFHTAPADWYGDHASFTIEGVDVADVICKDLGNWAAPPASKVAVDVRRGRIMFGTDREPTADPHVSYRYGFSGRVGGGPYPRERRRELPPGERQVAGAPPDPVADPAAYGQVLRVDSAGGAGVHTTVQAALGAWDPTAHPRTVIQIEDSSTYRLPPAGLTIPAAPAGAELVIQAGNRARPALLGDMRVASTPLARLILDGLLLEGTVDLPGELAELVVRHCTLVPGRSLDAHGLPRQPTTPSLTAAQPAQPRTVIVERSILGPIRMPAELAELRLGDTILDAPPPPPDGARVALAADGAGDLPGPAATIERCTVLGAVHVRELRLGSNAIFAAGPLRCERRQAGCLRFSSYEPEGSSPPRRFRCQPDLALEAADPGADAALVHAAVRPRFASLRYGEPAYAQLAVDGPQEIFTGADDGAEMGVFNHLRQPQREANLRLRLEEYLPFGLEPGLIFVT